MLLALFSTLALALSTTFLSLAADDKFNAPTGSAQKAAAPAKLSAGSFSEGKVTEARMLAGPFDLHRKYRSMEGPYVNQDVKVGELLDSQTVEAPESQVLYVELGGKAPPMMGSRPNSTNVDDSNLEGLKHRRGHNRELYWFKGIKLEVLDENNRLMPTAEFICHFNLDIDPARRNLLFRYGEKTRNPRLVSLTQGQTELAFPDGYGVPVASDEVWRFGFQAANRTSDEPRKVRHRCTVYFIKDSDLKKPMTALLWYVPYCTVVVDRPSDDLEEGGQHHSCLPSPDGVIAPNMGSRLAVFTDAGKRRLSGHWVVPPGTHHYSSPIVEERDPGFAGKDRRIHAAWTHIHPLCQSTSLVECSGASRRKLYEVNIITRTAGGLEIEHVDPLVSKDGILLEGGKRYSLEGTYLNETGMPQDSMISHGIFFDDPSFKKPGWTVLAVQEAGSEQQSTTARTDDRIPPGQPKLFNVLTDGPLLFETKMIELETSAGKIHLTLEPAIAARHATQIYRLLMRGAYDGTRFFTYRPDFLIQVGNVDFKVEGNTGLQEEQKGLLRRLPLEVSAQPGLVNGNRKWALSMARDSHPDSAVSSFCIMLAQAPQLDGKYTVFGHVVPDPETVATLTRIGEQWSTKPAHIIRAREIYSWGLKDPFEPSFVGKTN